MFKRALATFAVAAAFTGKALAQTLVPVWIVPVTPIVVVAASPTYIACVRNDTLQTIPYSAQGSGAINAVTGYLAPGQSTVFALQNAPWGTYPYFSVQYRDQANPWNVLQTYVAARLLTTADVDVFGRINCAVPEAVFTYGAVSSLGLTPPQP